MPGSRIVQAFACMLVCAVFAGCASKNYSTTLNPLPHSPGGMQTKFRIGHVDAMPGLVFFMTGYTDDEYWAKKVPDSATTADFPRQLKRFLEESYPGLFTEAADGTRVDIRFTISKFEETSTASSFLAAVSWGIFGIILPLPIAMQYDCALQLSIPDMALEQSAEFHNRMDTWVSFPSPLALIPVPAPARRRAIGVHPFQSRYYSGRLFILECFGQAVVQALEKMQGRVP